VIAGLVFAAASNGAIASRWLSSQAECGPLCKGEPEAVLQLCDRAPDQAS
jgi:hypothetical protein